MNQLKKTVVLAALLLAAAGALPACSSGEMVFGGNPSTDPPDTNNIYYAVNDDAWARSKLGDSPTLILSNKEMGTTAKVKNIHKVADLDTIQDGEWVMHTTKELAVGTTVHLCKAHKADDRNAPGRTVEKINWERFCFLEDQDLSDWQRKNNSLRLPAAK